MTKNIVISIIASITIIITGISEIKAQGMEEGSSLSFSGTGNNFTNNSPQNSFCFTTGSKGIGKSKSLSFESFAPASNAGLISNESLIDINAVGLIGIDLKRNGGLGGDPGEGEGGFIGEDDEDEDLPVSDAIPYILILSLFYCLRLRSKKYSK